MWKVRVHVPAAFLIFPLCCPKVISTLTDQKLCFLLFSLSLISISFTDFPTSTNGTNTIIILKGEHLWGLSSKQPSVPCDSWENWDQRDEKGAQGDITAKEPCWTWALQRESAVAARSLYSVASQLSTLPLKVPKPHPLVSPFLCSLLPLQPHLLS